MTSSCSNQKYIMHHYIYSSAAGHAGPAGPAGPRKNLNLKKIKFNYTHTTQQNFFFLICTFCCGCSFSNLFFGLHFQLSVLSGEKTLHF